MKTYHIQWSTESYYGGSVVVATTAREARAYMRKAYPGIVFDSFAVEIR